MPLTVLDAKTALVVIDLQKGIVNLPTAHPIEGVVAKASTLAGAFRSHGLPVVLVTVAGVPPGRTEQASRVREFSAGWADIVPELNQHSSDHTVVKRTSGAFTNTGLDEHLRNLGVTQIVIAGVATSIGVEATARHARDLGFNVTLATDAMTDMSADAHSHSIMQIFPKLGETGTAAQIMSLLDLTCA